MSQLLKNNRFYILSFSAVLAAAIYIWVKSTVQIDTGQAVKLDRLYALIAVFFLYFTLLITPLTKLFAEFPFREEYKHSGRALGVAAFFFALLHSYFSFFGELGGFAGLGFLDNKYLLSITLSATSLLILSLLALTSFDWAIEKLTFPKWKLLHKFIYLAGFLTIIHALMLGSDFTDFSALIPQIFITALVILLSLEMIRLDRYLKIRFENFPHIGLSFTIFLVLLGITGTFLYAPNGNGTVSPFNVHAVHIQIAKDAQQGQTNPSLSSNPALANIPGLQGDKTRRFTVSFLHPDNIQPQQDVTLQFQVFDASSGNQSAYFQRVYEKVMHLIIVDNELNYFSHIHPDQTSNNFTITTQFPHPGRYHLYTDFQPLGAIEQQFGFTIDVGDTTNLAKSIQTPDTNLNKTFGDYQVSMAFPNPLIASALSIGNQKLTFTIKDKNGLPVTNLKPYLAAFGHLVMINETTYDYLHVHPTNLVAPQPNQDGGPTVEFLPLGLYGPIKPGIYRVFAQFNPNNNLFVSDFTVEVK